MTDQEINIEIAEECGWKKVRQHWEKDGEMRWQNDDSLHYQQLPDYCRDLNAMHKAESIFLDDSQRWNEYVRKVFWIQSETPIQAKYAMVGLSIHSTARQRAEAFLRTLGKWKE